MPMSKTQAPDPARSNLAWRYTGKVLRDINPEAADVKNAPVILDGTKPKSNTIDLNVSFHVMSGCI